MLRLFVVVFVGGPLSSWALSSSPVATATQRRQREVSEALGFWDEARVEVVGGDGGNGCLAFRREKAVPLGGPSGGNGGRGGSVMIVCDGALNTLGVARRKTKYAGPSGANGLGSNRHAKARKDVFIRVPPGTVVKDWETGQVAGEVLEDGETILVAKGGRGGRGNAAFKTDRDVAPKMAERGEKGATRVIKLELSLAADVGIVGKPNAGKSTLLAAATAAKPKIADYAFTTLVPNLGVWEPYARPRKTSQHRRGRGREEEQQLGGGTRARRSAIGGASKKYKARREKKLNAATISEKRKHKRRLLDEDTDYYDTTGENNNDDDFRVVVVVEDSAASLKKNDDEDPVTTRPNVVDEFAEQQLLLALQRPPGESSPRKRQEKKKPAALDRRLQSSEDRGLVLADVPGLIEDAHLGRGMGDAFLRHVERCSVLLHVVDLTAEDPFGDFLAIDAELRQYSTILAEKPRVVALNKVDAFFFSEEEDEDHRLRAADDFLKKAASHRGGSRSGDVVTISAAANDGVDDLMYRLRRVVLSADSRRRGRLHSAAEVDFDPPFANSRANPDRSWTLVDGRDEGYDNQWRLDSKRLEKIAAMTNFEQPDAVNRFARVLEALGVAQDLRDRGARPGDLVMIGDDLDLEYDPYTWSRVAEIDQAAAKEEHGGGDDLANDYDFQPDVGSYESVILDDQGDKTLFTDFQDDDSPFFQDQDQDQDDAPLVFFDDAHH